MPAGILNRAWVGHSDYGGYYHQPTYSREKGAWATRPRGGGYFNNIHYTHSSTLRTFQEIFGVTALLGDAVNATDLSDLFSQFRLSSVVKLPGGAMQLTATGVIPGRTNLVRASGDLASWLPISTNVAGTNTFTVTDGTATNYTMRFYRLVQLP